MNFGDSDGPEDPRGGSPGASTSAQDARSRGSTAGHAYIGKPPPGWKEPTRFIIGKRPPSARMGTSDPVKRKRLSASLVEPTKGITPSQGSVTKEHASSSRPTGALRRLSPEIPFEENDEPSNSFDTSHTLVNNGRPPSPPRRPKSRRYTPLCQETIENAKLVIPNETIVRKPAKKELPVRLLRDFAIYEQKTKRMVSFQDLQTDMSFKATAFGASGYVEAFFDDDEDTDDELDEDSDDVLSSASAEPPFRVALSTLKEICIHHVQFKPETGFKLDDRIWLQTKFAFYILAEPDTQYLPVYAPDYIKHRLLHELVIASLAAITQRRDLSLDDFKQTIDTLDSPIQAELCLTADYLDCYDVVGPIMNTFEARRLDFPHFLRPLRKISVIRTLWSAVGGDEDSPPPQVHVLARTFDEVFSEATGLVSKTIVTPKVYELAEDIFCRKHLQRALTDSEDATPKATSAQHTMSLRLENLAQTGFKWVKESKLPSGHYQSAIFNGVRYNVGDTVVMEAGRDENQHREKHARLLKVGDIVADKYWFAKIRYMFEGLGEDGWIGPRFHGQWYYHGSKSLLHDLAHPQQLFPTDECKDQSFYSVAQKCKVNKLNHYMTPEPPEGSDKLFYGVLWDQERVAFREMPTEERRAVLAACQSGEECGSCGLRQVRVEQHAWHVESDCLRHGGVDFHIHDFVYLRPDAVAPALYTIGQIVGWDKKAEAGKLHRVKVRVYARYDEVTNKKCDTEKKDERLLVLTGHEHPFEIPRIEGKAFAVHWESLEPQARDKWVAHDDHFLVKQRALVYPPKSTSDLRPLRRKDVVRCQTCYKERHAALQEEGDLLARHGPLRCMELFAGAGGLATGLRQSGFVETKWAIELAPSAALSFAANHPDCTVYNQCTNVMLQHAIDTHHGRKPKGVLSRNPLERGPLPPMPRPGEVDLISGGPPCQSFSGANHYKRADDIRTTLVCNMVSYVEFYRPKYFLLENVVGMLSHRLGPKRDGADETGMSVVKFIFRALIALGYQVHCKVLQAAQYGAPQSRERAIFWGARRDMPLPNFPYPTHHYKSGSKSYDLLTGETLHRPVRAPPYNSTDREDYQQYAPFMAVTIQDAIGDLRKFDWENPHNVIASNDRDRVKREKRRKEGILSCSAVIDRRGVGASYSGFTRNESYLHPPLNRYQMQIRQGLDVDAPVQYHYTDRYTAKIVERVVNVPLAPGANHADLPMELRDAGKFKTDGTPKKSYARHFGRLDAHGQFRTTITTVKPNTMNGCVLHPTQKRVLTVRECARAQGFPDSYVLLSTQKVPGKIVDDQLRQIGNAVPVPLAKALGQELGKALLKMWKQQELERGFSPEVPMEVDSETES